MLKRVVAFSLIELMVVVTIVAILAAVALPVYREYRIRVQVSKAMPILNNIKDIILESYERTGVWPSSIDYNGVTINQQSTVNSSNFSLVNLDPVKNVHYSVRPDTSGNIVFLHGALTGLDGMPGFIEPPDNGYSAAGYSLIRYAIYDNNGVYEVSCGQYSAGNPVDIPLAYLPSVCQCSTMAGAFAGSPSC